MGRAQDLSTVYHAASASKVVPALIVAAEHGADPTVAVNDKAGAFKLCDSGFTLESATRIVNAWKEHGFWDNVKQLQCRDKSLLGEACAGWRCTAVVKALLDGG